MKAKKALSCLLAAALAVTGMVGGAAYTPLKTAEVSAAISAPASGSALLESAYITWDPISGAEGYNVYYKGDGDWVQIDSMLIRQYNSGKFRADAVGLKAGKYKMKTVPVISGKEDASKGIESAEMTVEAHDRSGYGWVGGTSSGAYNEDGTLKSNAVVVYVTNENKDTVTAEIDATGKGNETLTGVQNIITGYKKGKETRPIAIRFIGQIEDPANMPKGDLYVDSAKAGMTIEGIGNDTVFDGFGLVLKGCSNVEVRNLGFMNCDSEEGDDVGLQQDDDHCWVHNCDFFYGDAGSDADQVKGDGALDTKKSHYITHSYNHFWDNGKCNLQGGSISDTSDFITYHHNWYDHSDSRHPRVRVATVHAYNNYYDGNAKYGIGATTGASVFAENNYFRNCKYPIMIAMQGSDAKYAEKPDKGTFSGEDGGIIKAYGNVMSGQKSFIPYSESNTDFDAYVVENRSDTVPSSVTAKKGGATYNNFDTASDMYSYKADAANDVPAIVTAKAGRVDGGDLQWKFDNSVDDESYVVNDALKSALVNYKSSIIAIGEGFKSNITPVTTEAPTEVVTKPVTVTEGTSPVVTRVVTVTATPVETEKPTTGKPVSGGNIIYCSPNGGGDGKTIDTPTDVYTAISAVTPGGMIYLLEGTYKLNKTILIEESNSGSEDKYKNISAYPGADVVWDFSGMEIADANSGVILDGSYWYFNGFEIAKAGDNGMLLSGDHNIINKMVFNDNQDTGLQISRYQSKYTDIADWPSYNLVANCTSKNNCDNKSMENADGFAAKLTCGEGNVFDNCMSYNNSDDGWDLYAKTATGPIGSVTIQNCLAFRNGFTETGEGYGDCDGNGFKLGGDGVAVGHVIKNSFAFENLNCGFTDNNNPGLAQIINCTALNNGGGGSGKPNFSVYRCENCDFDNLMSYYSEENYISDSKLSLGKIANDKYVGTYANGVYYNSGYYKVDADVTVKNGEKIGTKYDGPTASSFILAEKSPAVGTDFHTAWRDADGSIKTNGFFETLGDYSTMGYHLTAADVPPIKIYVPIESVETTVTDKGEETGSTTVTTVSGSDTTTPNPTAPTPNDKVYYGDVDCNKLIESLDVVTLNRYLLDTEKNTLSDQSLMNANCEYDEFIDMVDSGKLINYVAEIITQDKLGPQ